MFEPPYLGIDDTCNEEEDEEDCGDPPAHRVRCPFVQHQLVRLYKNKFSRQCLRSTSTSTGTGTVTRSRNKNFLGVQNTIKSGNFVTFLIQNIFFTKFLEGTPYFFLLENSYLKWFRCWHGHFWPRPTSESLF